MENEDEMEQGQPQMIPVPSQDFTGGRFSEATIKWQETAGDILDDLEHDLRGEELNIENGQYVKMYEPVMNDAGIRAMKSMIRSRANRVIFLTKLDSDRIEQFCKDMNLDLVDQIVLKHQEWGLKKENCTMVVLKVVQLVYAAFMRAESEGERKFLSETRRVNEITTTQQQPAKAPGRFSFFK